MKIEQSRSTLLKDQAPATAKHYLAQCISIIDSHLGEGEALKDALLLTDVVDICSEYFSNVIKKMVYFGYSTPQNLMDETPKQIEKFLITSMKAIEELSIDRSYHDYNYLLVQLIRSSYKDFIDMVEREYKQDNYDLLDQCENE